MFGRYVAPLVLVAELDSLEARLYLREGAEVVEAVPVVTVITMTSPFRGMDRGIAMIAKSLRSLRRQPGFEGALSVIVADGVKEGSRWACPALRTQYDAYLAELDDKVSSGEEPFSRTILLRAPVHSGPRANFLVALNHVQTPLLYSNHHDQVFIQVVPEMPRIIAAMLANASVNYVAFAQTEHLMADYFNSAEMEDVLSAFARRWLRSRLCKSLY